MNKDVIYIDVDDDITAIIDKVKSAKERVVALVPPKRIGVLQSAVNLRLLSRAAENSSKRLVLISNSPQLQALAAGAKIPVAKNLQSKPEIPVIPELDSSGDDDVIDGAELPVGELARTADTTAPQGESTGKVKVSDNSVIPASSRAAASRGKANKDQKQKVPNFNKFRKKLLLFSVLGVLLIGFLVWAIWFAPRATIVVSARTSGVPISMRANLSSGQATDFDTQTLRVEVKETTRETNVEFEATGEEERGDRATGTMTLSQSSESDPVNVPAGTSLTSGDLTFVTDESVQIPGVRFSGGRPQGVGRVEVAVTAADIGSEYNVPARSYSSSIPGVSARGGQMSGGRKETVKIVTGSDMHSAREKLAEQNADAVRTQLEEEFGDSAKVIADSFVVRPEDPESSVDIGDEAPDGKATLTGRVHYRISGVDKSELDKFLESAIQSRLNDNAQQVYETGSDDAELSEFRTGDEGDSISLVASGQVGPRIDEDEVKEQSGGQRYGEVQSSLESIDGVNSVDVQFWPFWVNTVPSDTDRVSIEFKLEGDD